MADEKKKISAIVPVSLLDELRQQSDMSHTEAIIKGIELLVSGATTQPESDNKQMIEDKQRIRELEAENTILKEYNVTLKEELVKSGQREEDLKQMHNNYFMQVQTLINQKSIEAQGAKKPWWKIW
jgi:hypothetical protein